MTCLLLGQAAKKQTAKRPWSGAWKARDQSVAPRQPPCWRRGSLPQLGVKPVTDGRSPGSQRQTGTITAPVRRFPSPSRRSWQKRKGGRFVDKEASNPGRSLCHSSGFSGPSAHRTGHTTRPAMQGSSKPDGKPSLFYSRGVGCVWHALSGSTPSHSLLLSSLNLFRPKTIHL